MDHRNLYGIAAIILSTAVLVQSFPSANAGPQGPNVSMGSNPIENFSLICNNSTQTLVPINNSRDFIVTDVITGENAYQSNAAKSTLTFNGGIQLEVTRVQSHQFATGLKVPAGTSMDCQNNYSSNNNYLYNVTVLGYYAHS